MIQKSGFQMLILKVDKTFSLEIVAQKNTLLFLSHFNL